MYNKTIIRFSFFDIQNNQGLGKGYQITPTSTLIILDLTETSSNIILYYTLINVTKHMLFQFFAGLYSQGTSHVAIVCPNSIASESQTWQEALESNYDPTCGQPKQYLSSVSSTEFLEGWAK